MPRYIDADALKEKVRYSMLLKMGFINHCADAGREIPEEERKQIMESIDLHKAFIKLIDEQPTIEAQPKTGKWIAVHGYCTPGGDPVWACSECGKGVHVYGIEHGTYGADVSDGQWKACPNCGARMKEGDTE